MKASRWLLAAGALCHDGCSAHSEGGDQVSFSKPRQIVVTVTQSNEIFVNNSPTTIADLEAVLALKSLLAATKLLAACQLENVRCAGSWCERSLAACPRQPQE